MGRLLFLSPSASGPPAFVGPLDDLPAPAAAYSVARRLLSAYEGPLIRVRRSSDNAELDIGYDAAGDLDATALLTFCGVGDGFLPKLYDQSGNVRDGSEATAGNQLRLVASGVLDTQNSKPTANSNFTSIKSLDFSWSHSGNSLTAVAVATLTNNGPPYARFVSVSTAYGAFDYDNVSSALILGRNGTTESHAGYRIDPLGAKSMTYDVPASIAGKFDGTNYTAYTNGAAGTPTASNGNFGFAVGRIMNYTFSKVQGVQGKLSELVLWGSALSDGNRGAIEADQIEYYGIVP